MSFYEIANAHDPVTVRYEQVKPPAPRGWFARWHRCHYAQVPGDTWRGRCACGAEYLTILSTRRTSYS